MSALVGAKRSKPQLQEIAALLKSLYEKAEYGTWNEWAAEAGVHPTQVSGYKNAEAEPSGVNLFKLIETASRRIGLPPEDLARPATEELVAKMDEGLANQRGVADTLEQLLGAVSALSDSAKRQSRAIQSARREIREVQSRLEHPDSGQQPSAQDG